MSARITPLGSGIARLAQVPLGDWALGGLGFSMAAVSASFATYMIATAPAQVVDTGSKDFTVFATFDRRAPAVVTHGASQAPRAVAAQETASPPSPGIDPAPVGSIPTAGTTAQPRTLDPAPGKGALSEFHVRDVVGDTAVIEHRTRLTLVKPGSILTGAGEVLAIERRGDGWVVRTALGVIGGS